MPDYNLAFYCSMLSIVLPIAVFLIISLGSFVKQWQDKTLSKIVISTMLSSALISLGTSVFLFSHQNQLVVTQLYNLLNLGSYHLEVSFALTFANSIALFICAIVSSFVASFSFRYIYKEPGSVRFYALLTLFYAGINLNILGRTIDMIIVGWELVGISSVLLIGYYLERTGPMRNALITWTTYRISDLALLLVAIEWHHQLGATYVPTLMQGDIATQSVSNGFVMLLMIAILIKTGAWPFSFWLPRAMEGPTPSSAIFYGALAIHLGPILALRLSPIVGGNLIWYWGLIGFGLFSAGFSALIGKTRSDVKTQLAYATLAQVGLIIAEIGAGWDILAAFHIIGHIFFRVGQVLSSPSIIQVAKAIEIPTNQLPKTARLSSPLAKIAFRNSLLGFRILELAKRWIAYPLLTLSERLNDFEESLVVDKQKPVTQDSYIPIYENDLFLPLTDTANGSGRSVYKTTEINVEKNN